MAVYLLITANGAVYFLIITDRAPYLLISVNRAVYLAVANANWAADVAFISAHLCLCS